MAGKKYDRFEPQKKYLKKSRNPSIILLGCSGYLFLLVLVAALINRHFLAYLAIVLLTLPLVVISLCTLIKYNSLIKQFSRIKAGEVYEFKSYRPKVTFLTYKSGSRYVHDILCYGVTLYDYRTKTKYHYLLGEAFKLDKDGIEKVQAKLFKELHIQCYAGTTLIKTIENDPHFLKTRARYDYE